MVLRTPRAAWLAPLLLATASCLHGPPLASFSQATPIEVAIVLDRKSGAEVEGLPPEVLAALTHELERRNLTVASAPPAAMQAVAQSRYTRGRAEALAQALGPHHLFLLVELKASFFGQFDGGYKWDVSGQLTIASTEALAGASTEAFDLPAFLDRESLGEPDALQEVAPGIAERAGRAVDEYAADSYRRPPVPLQVPPQ